MRTPYFSEDPKGSSLWFGFILLLLTGVALSGCQGNNPSGAGLSTTVPAASGQTASSTQTTGGVFGILVEADRNTAITETAAALSVSIYLGDRELARMAALNNNSFTFDQLNPGFYNLKVADTANIYRTTFSVVEIVAGKISSTTIPLSRNPGATQETVDIIGRVIDTAHGAPIMFATVELSAPGQTGQFYRTTTTGNGYYFLEKIASGTWTLTYSKSNYFAQSFTLQVEGKNKVISQRTTITTSTTLPKSKGDGSDLTGFKIPDVRLVTQNATTGGITGQLRNPDTFVPLASTTTLVLYYRSVRSGTEIPAVIYAGFTTNDLGYLHLQDLPAGFYTIAEYGAVPTPKKDDNGNIIDWAIGDDSTTAKVERALVGWLGVTPEVTTPLPTSGFGVVPTLR